MKKNKDIEFAISDLEQVSGDEKLQRMAELKEKAMHDDKSALDYATEKGLAMGLEQGKAEGLEQGKKEKAQIISNMLASGLSIKQVQEFTKLNEKEIKELLK